MAKKEDLSGFSTTYDGYTTPGTYDLVFIITQDGTDGKYKTLKISKTLVVI